MSIESDSHGREGSDRSAERILAAVVGRRRELELVLASVGAGRDILLEGPPGTSKTTMLLTITEEWDVPLFLVEGNADLTPGKLIGYHDPSRVLTDGYGPDTFIAGPLVGAMEAGGFLYLEEFNRAPEDTLNVLLAAMAERRIAVPRMGTVTARDTFRIVASMNPYDNIGTSRLSSSVQDRLCRLAVDYQDADCERSIVALRVSDRADLLGDALVADAVALTRATREHPDVRQGASVRGAIDLVRLGGRLAVLRGVTAIDAPAYPELVLDAMLVALSARIHLDEAAAATPESVLRELWEDHFVLGPARAEPG